MSSCPACIEVFTTSTEQEMIDHWEVSHPGLFKLNKNIEEIYARESKAPCTRCGTQFPNVFLYNRHRRSSECSRLADIYHNPTRDCAEHSAHLRVDGPPVLDPKLAKRRSVDQRRSSVSSNSSSRRLSLSNIIIGLRRSSSPQEPAL